MLIFIFSSHPIITLPALKDRYLKDYEKLAGPLREDFDEAQIESIYRVLYDMPTINVAISLRGLYLDEHIDRSIKQPPSKDDWMEIHSEQVIIIFILFICCMKLFN